MELQLPRWKQLPEIALYMDQVQLVLGGILEPLTTQEGPMVTPTMINNYVKMKLTPPAVSHHMQILKDAGVVHCRKEGKYMYYSLDSSGKDIDQLLDLFAQMKEMLAHR